MEGKSLRGRIGEGVEDNLIGHVSDDVGLDS